MVATSPAALVHSGTEVSAVVTIRMFRTTCEGLTVECTNIASRVHLVPPRRVVRRTSLLSDYGVRCSRGLCFGSSTTSLRGCNVRGTKKVAVGFLLTNENYDTVFVGRGYVPRKVQRSLI